MPEIYVGLNVELDPGTTLYQAATGPGAAFQGESPGASLNDFRDGASDTVMLVEASPDQAVVWTKPEDWRFDPGQPRRGLGGVWAGGIFLAATADGSVTFIGESITDDALRAIFTRDAGDAAPYLD